MKATNKLYGELVLARHRKGDRYLSEEEYEKENDFNWIFILFILGSIVTGYYTKLFISDFEIEKWIKFTLIILSGFIGGSILSSLYKQIQILIGIIIIISLIYFFGNLLWSNI